MSNEILVALIGLAGSAVGSLCGVLVSSKLTQYRLEQLEKKVEKHNNLVERTYQLEQREELRVYSLAGRYYLSDRRHTVFPVPEEQTSALESMIERVQNH